MININTYRARVFGDGRNISDSAKESSKRQLVNFIMDSRTLSYVSINLDEMVPVPCIISDIRTYFERRFLFVPDMNINSGDYITTEDDLTYLATNRTYDSINPQVMGELCNKEFPINTITEKVISHMNASNRPIYKEIVTQIVKPCVMTDKIYSQANNSPIPLPDGMAIVKVPYSDNELEIPKVNAIVTIDLHQYKITTISTEFVFKGDGYLEIQLQRIPEKEVTTDDI